MGLVTLLGEDDGLYSATVGAVGGDKVKLLSTETMSAGELSELVPDSSVLVTVIEEW